MNIAYVGYQSGTYSLIEKENTGLLEFIQQKGLSAKGEIWDDPQVDWSAYDLVVLKAPWDYFDKFEAFKKWLDHIEQLNIRMLNPVSTVRWNSDKHYLKEIADAGLAVIPTIFLEIGQETNLPAYFEQLKADKLVIKPAVSGGAKNTFAFTREEAGTLTSKIDKLLKDEAFIVQPFLKQIQAEGEWSLMFFNGKLSHSLLKKAKSGDFRVQNIHGGTVHPMVASNELAETAQRYIDSFARGCLYARVDGVITDGKFELMELELIEPYYYLDASENGYENYYNALIHLIRN